MLWSLSFGNFSLLAVKLQLTEAMLNKYALGAFVQLHKLLRFTDEFWTSMEAAVKGRPAQSRPSTLRSICGDVVEKSCVVHRISPQTFVKYGHGLEGKEEESQTRASLMSGASSSNWYQV